MDRKMSRHVHFLREVTVDSQTIIAQCEQVELAERILKTMNLKWEESKLAKDSTDRMLHFLVNTTGGAPGRRGDNMREPREYGTQ